MLTLRAKRVLYNHDLPAAIFSIGNGKERGSEIKSSKIISCSMQRNYDWRLQSFETFEVRANLHAE